MRYGVFDDAGSIVAAFVHRDHAERFMLLVKSRFNSTLFIERILVPEWEYA